MTEVAAIDELTARRMYALADQLWFCALSSTDRAVAERMIAKPKPGQLVVAYMINQADRADGIGIFVREVKIYHRMGDDDETNEWADDDPSWGRHVATEYVIRRLTHPDKDFRWGNVQMLVLPDAERWGLDA